MMNNNVVIFPQGNTYNELSQLLMPCSEAENSNND